MAFQDFGLTLAVPLNSEVKPLKRSYLVTGGCGFVGRHMIKGLIQSDVAKSICIVDDLSTGRHPEVWMPSSAKRDNCKYSLNGVEIEFLHQDLRDYLRHQETSGTASHFSDVIHLAS